MKNWEKLLFRRASIIIKKKSEPHQQARHQIRSFAKKTIICSGKVVFFVVMVLFFRKSNQKDVVGG